MLPFVRSKDHLGFPPDNLLDLANASNPGIKESELTPSDFVSNILREDIEPEEFERALNEALSLASRDEEFRILLNECLDHDIGTLLPIERYESGASQRRIQISSSLLAQLTNKGFNFDKDTSLPLFIVNSLNRHCNKICPGYVSDGEEGAVRQVEGILTGLATLPISTFSETISFALKRLQNGPSTLLNWILTVPSTLTEEYRNEFDSVAEAYFASKPKLEWSELEALLVEPVYSVIAERALIKESQAMMGDPYKSNEPLLDRISVFTEHPWAIEWVAGFIGDYFTFLSSEFSRCDKDTEESAHFARLINVESRNLEYFIHSIQDTEKNESFEAKLSPILENCALAVLSAEPSQQRSFALTYLYDLEVALGDSWDRLDEKILSELIESLKDDNPETDYAVLLEPFLDRLLSNTYSQNWRQYSSSTASAIHGLEEARKLVPEDLLVGFDTAIAKIADFTRWLMIEYPRAAQHLKFIGFLEAISTHDLKERSRELEESLLSIEALIAAAPNHDGMFTNEEADKYCSRAAFETFIYVFEKNPLSSELSESDVGLLRRATEDHRAEYYNPDFAYCMSEALGMLGASRAGLSSDYIARVKVISEAVGDLVKRCDEKLYRERFLPSLFEAFMEVGIPLGPEV